MDLKNIYSGETVAVVTGSIVRTAIGIYRVDESDLQWLMSGLAKRRDFTAYDIHAIGERINARNALK